MTPEEITAFLAVLNQSPYALKHDLPDLLKFLLATGVRLGEALAVRWQDIDFDTDTVIVDHTIVRVKGAGLLRKTNKTSASERNLALPKWCIELLKEKYESRTHDEIVFPYKFGTWKDRNNVGGVIRKARLGTNIDWFVSHAARRTVATILDQKGLSARAIADQLGHARPSMTQDVYMGRKIASTAAAELLHLTLESNFSQHVETYVET